MRQQFPVPLRALFLSILFCICITLLLPPAEVSAHAYVIGSDPIDGSTVSRAPRTVHIYFNAAISSLSSAQIYAVEKGSFVNVSGDVNTIIVPNEQELVVPLRTPANLPEGSYLVTWRAVANADGQTTFGKIGFNVGYSSAGLAGTPLLGPSTSNDLEQMQALDPAHFTHILAVAWEWLTLLALVGWLGILVMEQFVLADKGRCQELLATVKKRTYSLQWLCLVTLLFGEVVSLLLRTVNLVEALNNNSQFLVALFSILTATAYGYIWLARFAFLLTALGLLFWSYRTPPPDTKPQPAVEVATAIANEKVTSEAASVPETPAIQSVPALLKSSAVPRTITMEKKASVLEAPPARRILRLAWILLAGGIVLSTVLEHASAQVLHPRLSAMLMDCLALVSQGVWFGGFAYLAYVLLPVFGVRERDYQTETLVALLRRVAPTFLVAMIVNGISTFFLYEASISNRLQLFNNPYGRTLFSQGVILVLTATLSFYTLNVLRPRLARQAVLLPVVDAELPARRLRYSALGNTQRLFKLLSSAVAISGVVVLLCSALLSFFSPPIVFPDVVYNNSPAIATSDANTQTKQLANLTVTLSLLPGHINEVNTLLLLVNDSSGKPVTDAQVQMRTNMPVMDMGTSQTTFKGGNPVYSITFEKNATFNMAGLWTVDLTIQRPNQEAVQGTFQVMLL